MAELTLLLPERDRALAGTAPGILAAWLARGDRVADAGPGRDVVLRECFEFTGMSVPTAALTRSLDAADAAGALWLRADPAWVMADAVTLRLLACGNMQLSRADCDELARALKPLFGDAGFLLEPATPERWYLRCPAGAQLPPFSPPQAALGDDIARHLPEGDAGRRWQHLLNEAQVILHNHPLNAERARRGLAPVNSLWFWGAGRLPDWVRTAHSIVVSSDEIVHALARLSGTPFVDAVPDFLDASAADARILIDLASLADAGTLETGRLTAIQGALARRAVSEVRLKFASGERFRYRHRHRWRFWRRIPAAREE
jgi:hypothetical protein